MRPSAGGIRLWGPPRCGGGGPSLRPIPTHPQPGADWGEWRGRGRPQGGAPPVLGTSCAPGRIGVRGLVVHEMAPAPAGRSLPWGAGLWGSTQWPPAPSALPQHRPGLARRCVSGRGFERRSLYAVVTTRSNEVWGAHQKNRSCQSANWPTALSALPLGGSGQGLGVSVGPEICVCFLGHHALLSRIRPRKRREQPPGAGAALCRWRRQSPDLLEPGVWAARPASCPGEQRCLSCHLQRRRQDRPQMGGRAPAGLGAACGLCLAREEALSVRWARVGRGSAGHGVCQVMVGTGRSAECWGMAPAVSF